MLISVNQVDPVGLTLFVQQASSGSAFSGNFINFATNSGFIGPTVVWTTGGSQTVAGSKLFTSPIGVPYSGLTGETVARLYIDNSIVNVSGVLVGYANILSGIVESGNSAFTVTGSSIVNNVNITGLGGTLVILSGNQLFISGAASAGGGGGGGGGAPNAVFQTGDQNISGQKIFTGNPLISAPTLPSGAVNLIYLSGVSGVLSASDLSISGVLRALATGISGVVGIITNNTYYITGTGTVNNTYNASGNINNVFNTSGNTINNTINATNTSSYNITNGSVNNIINLSGITGNFVNMSFYFDEFNLATGLNTIEAGVGRNFFFTGYGIGVITSGTLGIFSGSLYQRTPQNVKTNFVNLSINSGAFYTGVGGFIQVISGMNRVGVDIFSVATGITGLCLSLFGVGY